MYIAMNRFRIRKGCEEQFIEIWRSRESHLDQVPGFKGFHLLRGPGDDEHTLFASHSVWESRQHFIDWTESEAFRKAHTGAGGKTAEIYLGPPRFEGFEVVL